MSKKVIPFILFLLLPFNAFAQNKGLSIGYGFGLFNPHQETGKVEDDRSYDFLQLSFFHETQIIKNGFFVLEPAIAYVHKPEDGLDIGFNFLFKYYLAKGKSGSFYLDLGIGAAYTTIDFKEQGTHLLFSPQGGFGFRWDRFFIENRFRHYSNASLASPNRDVNANIISVGFYF